MSKYETYLFDVGLYPLQELALILQTVVQTQGLVGHNLFACEESIGSNAVVEVDYYNFVVRGANQMRSVQVCIAVIVEASTLNEDINRQLALGCCMGWGIDVGEQTVFGPLSAKFVEQGIVGSDAEGAELRRC